MDKNNFVINNEYDKEFYDLIEYLSSINEDDLLMNMIKYTQNLKNSGTYNGFINYFNTYKFWGTLNPDFGDFDALIQRTKVLKNHLNDFVWLYNKLNDYLSKRTLTAILFNWAFLDTEYINKVKSIFRDYWEPDIFLDNNDDVLVDVGAFNGDSIESYVLTYGMNYKKIYAYEITPDSLVELKANIKKLQLPNVVIRQKGAGFKNGKMFLDVRQNASSNNITNNGSVGVDIVRLEDDLDEIPTIIKMDIEGSEKDALKGLENTIRDHCPKLAICVYHGYNDLWEIPTLINEMNPNYEFYLRHNGGNLIPTEFVLLCKPRKK